MKSKKNSFGRLTVGMKVVSWMNRAGKVERLEEDPEKKPIVVRHEDGSIGFYHLDQLVELVDVPGDLHGKG